MSCTLCNGTATVPIILYFVLFAQYNILHIDFIMLYNTCNVESLLHSLSLSFTIIDFFRSISTSWHRSRFTIRFITTSVSERLCFRPSFRMRGMKSLEHVCGCRLQRLGAGAAGGSGDGTGGGGLGQGIIPKPYRIVANIGKHHKF